MPPHDRTRPAAPPSASPTCAASTAGSRPSTASPCTSSPASSSRCSGPSGCGKTTALRCLAGLEDPDSGTVEVGGHDLTRVPANKRDMGMVFQAYSLFPHMTARQNVEFGLELRGRDRATRRARTAEMLDLVGLDDARRQVRPPALRRPAAARRAGPRPGHRAAGAAARRAALGARRQGAHPAARRDPPHPARGRHDDAVRHPRPGGGPRGRRPGRRDVGRPPRAARRPGRALQRARRRRSSPTSSA